MQRAVAIAPEDSDDAENAPSVQNAPVFQPPGATKYVWTQLAPAATFESVPACSKVLARCRQCPLQGALQGVSDG
jgi:hypothetical protein